MKKRISVLLLVGIVAVLAFSGCKKEEVKDERTLSDIVKAYTDEGIEVDLNEKPFYDMIGAKDGVIFKVDNSSVKIYEYASISDLNKAVKENEMMKDWPTKGKFVLESSKDKAIEIFNTLSDR